MKSASAISATATRVRRSRLNELQSARGNRLRRRRAAVEPARLKLRVSAALVADSAGRYRARRRALWPLSALYPGNSIGSTVLLTTRRPENSRRRCRRSSSRSAITTATDSRTVSAAITRPRGSRTGSAGSGSLSLDRLENNGQPMQYAAPIRHNRSSAPPCRDGRRDRHRQWQAADDRRPADDRADRAAQRDGADGLCVHRPRRCNAHARTLGEPLPAARRNLPARCGRQSSLRWQRVDRRPEHDRRAERVRAAARRPGELAVCARPEWPARFRLAPVGRRVRIRRVARRATLGVDRAGQRRHAVPGRRHRLARST